MSLYSPRPNSDGSSFGSGRGTSGSAVASMPSSVSAGSRNTARRLPQSRVSFFAVGKGGPANTTIEPIPFSLKEVEGACSSAAFYCILALPEDEYDEALEVQLDGGIGFTVETSTHSYKIKYPLTPKDMQSCRKEFFEYCATRASEQDNTYTVSLAIDQIFSGMFPSLGERTKM